MSTDYTCAIDLGTCNSTIAVYYRNEIQCIAEPVNNSTIIPSIVTLYSGDITCGYAAQLQSFSANSQVYRDVKCIKGRQFKDIKNYEISCWPFELFGKPGVRPEQDDSYPQLVSFQTDANKERVIAGYAYPPLVDALLLSYMTTLASRRVGHEIKQAVITVPAFFTESQIYTTLEAAEMAGLSVSQIIPEPCAAAIRYTEHAFRYVLVFDFGGGTLDTTLMEYKNGQFRILSTSGNLDLGGRQIDLLLLKKICEHAEEQGGHIDPTSRKYQRLLNEVERMKIRLSSVEEVVIDYADFFTTDSGKPLNYEHTLTRDVFNQWVCGLLSNGIRACEDCLEKERVTLGSGDAILLTGGTSQIPLISELLKKQYEGVSIKHDINPQEVVAQGACVMGLREKGVRLPLIPDFTLGLSTMYMTFYSFGEQGIVLVKEDTLHTVITHCTIHVPSNERYMFLWQEVNNKPLYIGYVDVSNMTGRDWKVNVSYTKQSLIELKDVDRNEVVPIQYGCAIPKRDCKKFTVLNDFLSKVRKAISRLDGLREYRNKSDVRSLLLQLRGIAAEYMFKDLNEESYEYINNVMIPRLEEYSDLYE